ncbi:MAG: DUF1592 domain-containing protein [Acidimicrobiia bacterium]|nr:DUF1592 domain-containing protein [Acidimicrobiia bacterium]
MPVSAWGGRWAAVVGALLVTTSPVRAQSPEGLAQPSTRAFLDRYCVTCHNERLRQSGLMLDRLETADSGGAAETWEKVVRKLRTGAMPPQGRPRPDAATYDAVATAIEQALDRVAAASPDPGRMPALRRLSRTEYANAIRDLLGIAHLPKGMDLALLLPADNSRSGFDNLADLLFVSPTVLDGYLNAAREISRLAVGDPGMPLLVDTYRVPSELPQERQLEGFPAGTRGGTRIQTYLPAVGEYRMAIDVSGASREVHGLEVAVDGDRVGLVEISRAHGESYELRLPLTAGPHVITATFVPPSGALSEEPVLRANNRGGSGATAGLLGQRLPALAAITVRGPYGGAGAAETPARRRLFVCRPASDADEAPCARRILSTFVTRAYRRPATSGDLDLLLPFFEEGRQAGGFDAGIQRALERLLVSPQFLFRIEKPTAHASGAPARVSDLELASRLSFFLWSSLPDDELIDVAARGTLRAPGEIDRQVRRMLADPRAAALATNFAAQWLFLRDVETRRPDGGIFADFEEGLRRALLRETELFIGSVFRENRSVLDLLEADYTFLNERLAKHYGIPHVYGSHFRRVALDPAGPRGGLLGQGSILLLTSYPTRTSPVLRGKYVLDNLLGAPPPPPPPDVPALQETGGDGTPLSMREAMERHRVNPVCASCHAQMDPVGFALENFDGLGRWRTTGESGDLIDARSALPDGREVAGATGVRDWLLAQSGAFVQNFTERLLTYALGRDLDHRDMPVVRGIVRGAARDDYAFGSLVLGVVESLPFQMRRSEAARMARE